MASSGLNSHSISINCFKASQIAAWHFARREYLFWANPYLERLTAFRWPREAVPILRS